MMMQWKIWWHYPRHHVIPLKHFTLVEAKQLNFWQMFRGFSALYKQVIIGICLNVLICHPWSVNNLARINNALLWSTNMKMFKWFELLNLLFIFDSFLTGHLLFSPVLFNIRHIKSIIWTLYIPCLQGFLLAAKIFAIWWTFTRTKL